ncbi:MAG: hypothetical protein SPI72_01155 [Porphyromonas sp.]|nr:hypothetical protein [Porphyromonas sp.]
MEQVEKLKELQKQEQKIEASKSTAWESTLRVVAWLSIIAALISIVAAAGESNPAILIGGAVAFLSGISLHILCNISTHLSDIKEILSKDYALKKILEFGSQEEQTEK